MRRTAIVKAKGQRRSSALSNLTSGGPLEAYSVATSSEATCKPK